MHGFNSCHRQIALLFYYSLVVFVFKLHMSHAYVFIIIFLLKFSLCLRSRCKMSQKQLNAGSQLAGQLRFLRLQDISVCANSTLAYPCNDCLQRILSRVSSFRCYSTALSSNDDLFDCLLLNALGTFSCRHLIHLLRWPKLGNS